MKTTSVFSPSLFSSLLSLETPLSSSSLMSSVNLTVKKTHLIRFLNRSCPPSPSPPPYSSSSTKVSTFFLPSASGGGPSSSIFCIFFSHRYEGEVCEVVILMLFNHGKLKPVVVTVFVVIFFPSLMIVELEVDVDIILLYKYRIQLFKCKFRIQLGRGSWVYFDICASYLIFVTCIE